jgi:holo-[acyl-carrier protein] synthase
MKKLFSQGIDIVSVTRLDRAIQRSGTRFLQRIFGERELDRQDEPGFLATRFAAKEAFFKALGSGVSSGVRWHDFILPPAEKYSLDPIISGISRDLLGSRIVLVSVSRTDTTAVAVVFLDPLRGEG